MSFKYSIFFFSIYINWKQTPDVLTLRLLSFLYAKMPFTQPQITANISSCLKVTWQMANCKVDIPLESLKLLGRSLFSLLCSFKSVIRFILIWKADNNNFDSQTPQKLLRSTQSRKHKPETGLSHVARWPLKHF